jgi:hypothetical protein
MNINVQNQKFAYLVGTVIVDNPFTDEQLSTIDNFRIAILGYAGIYTDYKNLTKQQKAHLRALYHLITAPSIEAQ